MSQAPLFLFLPLIWPAVHMLKNLITVPSRKGLRHAQHSSMAFGMLLPLLSPTEEPAHLVWSCAIAYGKGSSMSVCPSFFPGGYSYTELYLCLTDPAGHHTWALPSHRISLPTGTSDNRRTPTERHMGEKDVLNPSHHGRSQIPPEVQKPARNYLKQGQIPVIVITSLASFWAVQERTVFFMVAMTCKEKKKQVLISRERDFVILTNP